MGINNPQNPLSIDYNTPVLEALRTFLCIDTLDAQASFFNRRLTMGRNEQTVITFLNRASARIHETILNKFIKALVLQKHSSVQPFVTLFQQIYGAKTRFWKCRRQ